MTSDKTAETLIQATKTNYLRSTREITKTPSLEKNNQKMI